MAHQTVLTDGGHKPAPVAQYQAHKPLYSFIEDRLETLFVDFMAASRETQETLIRGATEYAIISVQTRVDFHEPAFLELQESEAETKEEIADILADHTVQYHNNKGRYIAENRQNVNFDAIAQTVVGGDIESAHERIAENCLGLGSAKAAFSLAMLGVTELMCIDSHTAKQADLDIRAGADVTIDEYRDLQREIYSLFGELSRKVPPYVYQWVMFDTSREQGVEMHDPWFLWAEQHINSSLL